MTGGHRDWRRVRAHADTGGRRVEEVDGLVGQLASRQIAARQTHGRPDCGIGDVHAVVSRVAVLQATQHQTRVVVIGLVDLDHLEAAFERGIPFNVLFVFGPGGRGDRAQLAARKRRLQQIRRVGAPRCIACADERVRFVDEQQNRCG